MSYLLNSGICLLILLLIYRLFLQKESMYQFNRFFLLFSIVVSFLIPLITVEVTIEKAVSAILDPINPKLPIEYQNYQTTDTPTQSDFDWRFLGWGIYFFVSGILLYRFFRNIKLILEKVKNNEIVDYNGYKLVLVQEDVLPFSFLTYIFLSKAAFQNGKITESILQHESTHVREWHSLDNIFIEFLLVFMWFHPGLYWSRSAIKLNHEFIADEAALRVTTVHSYKLLLVSMILPNQSPVLASNLKFSFTKRRLDMMNKKTMLSTKLIKAVALIPVLAVLIFVFSEKVPAQDQITNKQTLNYHSGIQKPDEGSVDLIVTIFPDGNLKTNGKEIRLESFDEYLSQNFKEINNLKVLLEVNTGTPMGYVSDIQKILFERGATHIDVSVAEQVANDSDKAEFYKNSTFIVVGIDGNKTKKTYKELTEKQKSDLRPPMGKPEKKSPNKAAFDKWKDSKTYAIWIDGVSVKNDKLAQMLASEIAFYNESFVHLNAKSERFPQEYQVHAYTHPGYEAAYGENSDYLKNRNWTITIKD